MVKGIAHLAFQVSDMDKSVAFYENILGFKKKFTLGDDGGKPWIVYLQVSKNQFIELFYAHQELERSYRASSYQHLCVEVEEIHRFADEIVKKGVPLDKEVTMGLDNNFQCWISDPDGNPIELMEYGLSSLQLR